MRYQIIFVSILVILSKTYTSVYAQTVSPTTIPALTVQPVSTQSPTSTSVLPTPTVEPWPTGHIATPPPYDWCNGQYCGYNEHYTSYPVGAGSFMTVGTASNKNNNQNSNQSGTNPTPTNKTMAQTTTTPAQSSVKYMYYQKNTVSLFPTPFATPTIFTLPSATPSAKPLLKSSVIKPSFFESIWNFLSHVFGKKLHLHVIP